MPTLTGVQVAAYAAKGGITTRAQLEIAVAIAKAESGWRSDAMGDTTITTGTWGPSIGLWQIRSLKAETGTGGTRDANKLKDPEFNARSMVAVSGGGTNWRPWSVYTSGAYRNHLPAAKAAVDELATSLGGAITGAGAQLDTVAGAVAGAAGTGALAIGEGLTANPLAQAGALLAALSSGDTWKRVAFVGAGILFALLAVVFIFADSGIGRAAATVIPAPTAAVLGAVKKAR